MGKDDELEALRAEVEFLRKKVALLDRTAEGTKRFQSTRIFGRQSPRMNQKLSIAAIQSCYLAVDEDLNITAMNSKMAALLGVERRTQAVERKLDQIDKLTWAPGILGTLLYDARDKKSEQTFEVEHPSGTGASKDTQWKKFTAVWSHGTGTIAVDDVTRLKTISRHFELYVSPQLMSKLQNTGSDLLRTERRDITVMFADLRGFTRAMNTVEDTGTVQRVVNDFLDTATQCVDRYEGMTAKFLGDGFMALFGAPLECADHAARAIQASYDLLKAVDGLLLDWKADGLPMLDAGIGISTGECIVGNVGSSRKMEYTALGANVNLASRLCGEAQGGQVLLSETTVYHADRYRRRLRDAGIGLSYERDVPVKGFDMPVPVHSIIERAQS